jgi:hypothetical protein
MKKYWIQRWLEQFIFKFTNYDLKQDMKMTLMDDMRYNVCQSNGMNQIAKTKVEHEVKVKVRVREQGIRWTESESEQENAREGKENWKW